MPPVAASRPDRLDFYWPSPDPLGYLIFGWMDSTSWRAMDRIRREYRPQPREHPRSVGFRVGLIVRDRKGKTCPAAA